MPVSLSDFAPIITDINRDAAVIRALGQRILETPVAAMAAAQAEDLKDTFKHATAYANGWLPPLTTHFRPNDLCDLFLKSSREFRLMQFQTPIIIPHQDLFSPALPDLSQHLPEGITFKGVADNYGDHAALARTTDNNSLFGFATLVKQEDGVHKQVVLPSISLSPWLLDAFDRYRQTQSLQALQRLVKEVNHDDFHFSLPLIVQPYTRNLILDMNSYSLEVSETCINYTWQVFNVWAKLFDRSCEAKGNDYEFMALRSKADIFEYQLEDPGFYERIKGYVITYLDGVNAVRRAIRADGDFDQDQVRNEYTFAVSGCTLMALYLLRVVPKDHALLQFYAKYIDDHLGLSRKDFGWFTFSNDSWLSAGETMVENAAYIGEEGFYMIHRPEVRAKSWAAWILYRQTLSNAQKVHDILAKERESALTI